MDPTTGAAEAPPAVLDDGTLADAVGTIPEAQKEAKETAQAHTDAVRARVRETAERVYPTLQSFYEAVAEESEHTDSFYTVRNALVDGAPCGRRTLTLMGEAARHLDRLTEGPTS